MYFLRIICVQCWTNCKFVYSNFQEADGQKTNNGIQYRLQLLYANGELNHVLVKIKVTILTDYRKSIIIPILKWLIIMMINL